MSILFSVSIKKSAVATFHRAISKVPSSSAVAEIQDLDAEEYQVVSGGPEVLNEPER